MSTFCNGFSSRKTKSSGKKNTCKNIQHHKFQVAHPAGIKWKSTGSCLHDSVTLSMNGGKPEHWRLERQEDEPLWSFHVLSKKGEKLYVSYDGRSDDITLELKDDSSNGKKRFFLILVQDNGLYHFRAQNISERYIRSNDGRLEMFTTSVAAESMKWLLKETLDTLERPENDVVVQVMDNSRKWISTDVRENQPISVLQHGEPEEWHLNQNEKPATWKFSPINQSTLFASTTTVIPDTILLEGQYEEAGIILFTPFKTESLEFKLQNVSTSKWLAVSDDEILILKPKEEQAVNWDVILTRFRYEKGKHMFLFPALRLEDKLRRNDT